jgi:predicted PP-loop superfamily ATPase
MIVRGVRGKKKKWRAAGGAKASTCGRCSSMTTTRVRGRVRRMEGRRACM